MLSSATCSARSACIAGFARVGVAMRAIAPASSGGGNAAHAHTPSDSGRRATGAGPAETEGGVGDAAPEPGGVLSWQRRWIVSTPHPGSRLRKILPASVPGESESAVDRELREQLEHDFTWHHEFWSKHNRDFAEEKKAFTDAYRKEHSLAPDVRVPADDVSVFYQDFLIRTADRHREYSRRWRRRNAALVWLRIRCAARRLLGST